MRALIAMTAALAVLVVLLQKKVKVGKAMMTAAVVLTAILGVGPISIWNGLVIEWHEKHFTETTGYLFVSLTALLLFVNVIGAIMVETGISKRLTPAIHGLFRSRRISLAAIPLMMGMLPTPGGIMLSAPMVKDMGESMKVSAGRIAAINFYFRHQFEPVWPLFPALPLAQAILAVPVIKIICYNSSLIIASILSGIVFLLFFGIPKSKTKAKHKHLLHNLKDFIHGFWPIALSIILYAGWNIPPAAGVLVGIIGLLILHKLPFERWRKVFSAAKEPDLVLLILAAMVFKLCLNISGAIPEMVDLMSKAQIPPFVILFALPFFVAFLTGITSATVAITFPFLISYIGTSDQANIALATLAFSGAFCGLMVTPVHLCLALSAGYFKVSIIDIVAKIIWPVITIAVTGFTVAFLLG